MAIVVLELQKAGIDAEELVAVAGHADGVKFNNLYRPLIVVNNTDTDPLTITIVPEKKDITEVDFEAQVYTIAASKTFVFRLQNDYYQDSAENVTLALSGVADPTLVKFSALSM